jgi:hypothetical protein
VSAGSSSVGRLLDGLSRLSPQQRLLRTVPVPATVGFLLLVAGAGGAWRPIFAVPALLLAMAAALAPDSGFGLYLMLALVVLWAEAVPQQVDGWLLGAGLVLLVLHLTLTLAGVGPPGITLSRWALRGWLLRALALAAAGLVVWLAARLLAGTAEPSGWAMGIGLAVLLGWLAWLTVRLAVPE